MNVVTPPWYITPDLQIGAVVAFLKRFGGEDGFTPEDIPELPESITQEPGTEEIPLLAVYLPDNDKEDGLNRTLKAWFWSIGVPNGCIRAYSGWHLSDSQIRLQPDHLHEPGIRWVMFNPYAYAELRPQDALTRAWSEKKTLAGTEVLMAAAIFTRWKEFWLLRREKPVPKLTPLRVLHPTQDLRGGVVSINYAVRTLSFQGPPGFQGFLDPPRPRLWLTVEDHTPKDVWCYPTIREI